MLTFESPFYELEDVIIFRDYASPTTFHYLTGPPRLTRSDDGVPNLLLLKYKNAIDAMTTGAGPTRDQLGGAFLMFGVDCGLSESTKSSIKNKLQAFLPPDAGEISLVPVLFTKGKVSVIALDQQSATVTAEDAQNAQKSQFIRGILGSATPSLLQDQRAIFSISLTPDAATLIEQAYDSDLSPIGVMYELEFAGLRPALSVKAVVDMKRVYESLKLGLHLGLQSGGGTPTATQPSQPTQPTQPTQPAPSQTPAARPTTQPTTSQPNQPAAKGTAVYLSADIGYSLEKLKQEEAIKIEIVREQEGASVDQMETNAMQLLKETVLNQFFQPAMTTSPATAATAAAGAASQYMATTPDTSKGQSGQTKVEIGFQLQYKKEEELKTATFDYSVIAPETRTHAPNGFFSALLTKVEKAKHIREINLDDPFFKILNVEVSTTADFATLDLQALTVEMQYGGTTSQPQVVGAATFLPSRAVAQRFMASLAQNDYSYRYKASYSFGQAEDVAAQRSKIETPWRLTTTRALVVHPPEDIAMLHLYIEPGVVDWDVVSLVETRLMYDDPAHNFHAERTFLVKSDSKRQEWIVRLTDPQVNTYQVQYRWHLKDLSEIQGKPMTRADAHLFVADPFVDRLPVTVDPHVDPANVARINVELLYDDPANNFSVRKQVEIEAPFKRSTATIPIVDASKREFSYAISLVKPNGQAESHAPKTTDQLSIIITEGGVYLDVDVVLIGDLATFQVDALQVDLQAEPLDGVPPKIESHLFVPGDAKKYTQRLLLRADRPTQFQYRTKVLAAGNEIDGDWTTSQSKILLLQVQRLVQPS